MITNDDSKGRILLSYPHTNNGFFFLLSTAFLFFFFSFSIYFKICFQESLNMLRCNSHDDVT